eukprot:GHVU01036023.1.p1 GENE.GHVU01036023.1~~GHVU01036023.1.p1  ORF type:complete len:137 (+),score=3.28 GHVU01036023.1:380-790(+)
MWMQWHRSQQHGGITIAVHKRDHLGFVFGPKQKMDSLKFGVTADFFESLSRLIWFSQKAPADNSVIQHTIRFPTAQGKPFNTDTKPRFAYWTGQTWSFIGCTTLICISHIHTHTLMHLVPSAELQEPTALVEARQS